MQTWPLSVSTIFYGGVWKIVLGRFFWGVRVVEKKLLWWNGSRYICVACQRALWTSCGWRWVFSFSIFWAMQRDLTSPISVMFWCFNHLLQSSPELCTSHEFVMFSIRMLSIALLSFFNKVYMCDVHYRFSVMLISKNLQLFIHSTSASLM